MTFSKKYVLVLFIFFFYYGPAGNNFSVCLKISLRLYFNIIFQGFLQFFWVESSELAVTFYFSTLNIYPIDFWVPWFLVRIQISVYLFPSLSLSACPPFSPPSTLWRQCVFSLDFFKIKFYWSIVDLQCWVSFCYTAQWISYTFTYIYSFLDSIPI